MEKKLNPHANTPTAVKMNEINPKYENTPAINSTKETIQGFDCSIFFYIEKTNRQKSYLKFRF
jgi:hypothetical protein